MDEPQPPPEKKERKSDHLRQATVEEWLRANAKPNGHGWRGFIHSNLFVALLLWCLSQAVICGGFIVSSLFRTNQLSEWKGQTDSTLKRMDDWGTIHGHFNDEREDKELADLEARMKKSEEEGRHWEVIESEHRRLTKDVENLQNERKK